MTSRSRSSRARRSGSSGETAPARRRCCASSRGSSSRRRGAPRSAARSARCSSSARASTRTSPGARTSSSTGRSYGLKRAYVRERIDEIVAFAELEQFIDLPVRTYSSGMYMRLGFSIASHLEADVLLLDEVFAVGDEAFQRKCFGKIFDVQGARRHDRASSRTRASPSSACASARCSSRGRGGVRRLDARRDRPLPGAARARGDPEERGAGLNEWGSGEARVAGRSSSSAATVSRASSSSPESRCRCASGSSRAARAAAASSRSSCMTGRVAARGSQRDRRARLGRMARRAWAPVRGRLAAARGRTLRDRASSLADSTGRHLYHRSRRRRSSSSPPRRARRPAARGRWSLADAGRKEAG